ncbi:hypothetical protein WJ96_06090 [Burkholderia ubonensis]|uniref:Uncharacterized protein n=1 Tax=Burkholderia ubonensis TaxID=101571 RepID=A0AAW3MWH9_9BURK|nr:hypothetical protein [Burkholderia ubonensis]KVP75328.1 hypothetical protein WJ93_07890 [Burkholderia ubonensis]KVP98140.1 hypothetical protein WJ96_06090 [Burkholderia ubonensis]KVZ92837.1 hypothetical protein WL25_17750 [Burkholderia ubonensis]
MGSSNWSSSDWQSFSSSTRAKSTAQVFSQHGMHADLNPRGVAMRESRDSAVNPNSHAIIVASDVTGSMGILAEALVRKGMGVLVEELLARKPVHDPHIMCMGVGDAYTDMAPLQVTQFEADIRIAEQLSQIWLEGRGGGNGGESYPLAWYFAARHTSIDCFEKRQKKGYLFTVGDENPHKLLTRDQVKSVFGDDIERDLTSAELLTMASRSYHVFHLLVEESRTCDASVKANWKDLLGERALLLSDHTKLAELIVSTIQVNEGWSVADAVKSWSGDTSVVVARGLNSLQPAGVKGTGLVRF